MRFWYLIIGLVVLIAATISFADGPAALFKGGERDGYSSNVSTNNAIPNGGTVIFIR